MFEQTVNTWRKHFKFCSFLFIFFFQIWTQAVQSFCHFFPSPFQRKWVVQLVHSILNWWKNRSKKKKCCYIRRWWGKSVQEEETNRWTDAVRETNKQTVHTLLILLSLCTRQMHRILSNPFFLLFFPPFLHKYLHFPPQRQKLPLEWKAKQTAPGSAASCTATLESCQNVPAGVWIELYFSHCHHISLKWAWHISNTHHQTCLWPRLSPAATKTHKM